MKQSMKAILLMSGLFSGHAFASGVYTFTSHAYITGASTWAVSQPGLVYQNSYNVSATTTIGTTSITGDPQFTLANAGCAGAKTCVETVTFSPLLGGDYVANLFATSTSALRTRASSTSFALHAHVAGANYTVTPAASSFAILFPETTGSMLFTVTSTGETALHIASVTAGDFIGADGTLLNSGKASVNANDCPQELVPGATCVITAQLDAGGVESDIGYYSTLLGIALSGDTRRQAASKVAVTVSLQ